jgi:hypothetical protein
MSCSLRALVPEDTAGAPEKRQAKIRRRAAITRGAPGIYNIVDDDPARVSQWLPALAAALGAKPPRRIPAWIARFAIGDAVVFMTDVRGASNAKAKQAFGLNLIWPSWRGGFKEGLGDPSQA